MFFYNFLLFPTFFAFLHSFSKPLFSSFLLIFLLSTSFFQFLLFSPLHNLSSLSNEIALHPLNVSKCIPECPSKLSTEVSPSKSSFVMLAQLHSTNGKSVRNTEKYYDILCCFVSKVFRLFLDIFPILWQIFFPFFEILCNSGAGCWNDRLFCRLLPFTELAISAVRRRGLQLHCTGALYWHEKHQNRNRP